MAAADLLGKMWTPAAQMAGRKVEGCGKAGGPWPLLPLNEVPEEPGDLWPGDAEPSGRRSAGGLHDKEGDLFERNNDDGHLCENGGLLEASNFWFGEDTEVFLGQRSTVFTPPMRQIEMGKKWVDRLPPGTSESIAERISAS